MPDLMDMSGLLGGYPSSYWQSGSGMTPYWWVPTGYDPFLWPAGQLSGGMATPPDAPMPPPAAPQVPPVPSAPNAPMPVPGSDMTPPGLLNPPPVAPPPMMQPPPPAPPPPPGFGQPGFDPILNPQGKGGTGRQGGGATGAGSSGLGGGGPGPKGSQAGGYGRGGSYAMAHGGVVTGERDNITDNRPRNLDEGEFVVSRKAAEAFGYDLLDAINDPKLAPGIRKAVESYLASRR